MGSNYASSIYASNLLQGFPAFTKTNHRVISRRQKDICPNEYQGSAARELITEFERDLF